MFSVSEYLKRLQSTADPPEVRCRVPLSSCVTIRIGGEADALVCPATVPQFCRAVRLADACGCPFCILGGGSNLLPSDRGFHGAVISTQKMAKIEFCDQYITAECGAPLNLLIRLAANCGLGGLERLYGIPATVGGAVYMNAGAHSAAVSDCLTGIEAFDRHSGQRVLFSAAELALSYRSSLLQSERRYILLRAFFHLQPSDPVALRSSIREVCRIRRSTQPLEYPSAGSVFRRPREGAAWQWIDACGLRGHTVGGAQISEKHAGFIINRGGATAADVRALISLCRERVLASFGVTLVREIEFLE